MMRSLAISTSWRARKEQTIDQSIFPNALNSVIRFLRLSINDVKNNQHLNNHVIYKEKNHMKVYLYVGK